MLLPLLPLAALQPHWQTIAAHESQTIAAHVSATAELQCRQQLGQ